MAIYRFEYIISINYLSWFVCPTGPTNEPPLPRRKKCPELAYKSHEFIIGSEYTDARRDASAHRAARVSIL